MVDSKKVLKLRLAKGVSQNTVANETGLPKSVVNKIESGRVSNPLLCSILALARYYEVKIDSLLKDGV